MARWGLVTVAIVRLVMLLFLGNSVIALLPAVAALAMFITMVPVPVFIVAVSVATPVGIRSAIGWRPVGGWVRLAGLACRAVTVLLSWVADGRSVRRLAVPSSLCRHAPGAKPGRHDRGH